MASDDAIDDCWDELHPRALEAPPSPSAQSSPCIQEIDGLTLGPGAHLVLAWSRQDLFLAIHRFRSIRPGGSGWPADLTSPLPCLIYGDDHWTVIERDLGNLLASDKQAFIGTMNTFVIDTFYFHSAEDFQSRFLLAEEGGHVRRISEEQADAFHRAYETGVQHVSEIIRSDGLW